ncbi:MAG: hypothetical protein HY297_06255 [Thaumarchaeota archaeon]|nr:hypothetical protein [Nitrososphaerota archaeon]
MEYSLVVIVSTLFVGGSLATYQAYSRFESTVEDRAAFSSIVDVARQALANGSSYASIAVPDGSISCSAGALQFESSNEALTARLPASCAFFAEFSRGRHVFSFSSLALALSLAVS